MVNATQSADVAGMIEEAARAAAAGGHTVAGWAHNGATGWRSAWEAACVDCSAVVRVEPEPAPNSVELSGTVFSWRCDGGARLREHTRWAGKAWDVVAFTCDGADYCVPCAFRRFSPAATAGEAEHMRASGRTAPVVPVFDSERDELADASCSACWESLVQA